MEQRNSLIQWIYERLNEWKKEKGKTFGWREIKLLLWKSFNDQKNEEERRERKRIKTSKQQFNRG